ncbi:MAG: hypothetical protein EPN48_03325 [Microbacteriaceae bacterium]|nr:MAG: hypothetical protein EPN48_03325 [Microbacteriaceae bacterium]
MRAQLLHKRIMDVYSHLVTERIIYLGTAIDPGVANALIARLLHLDVENSARDTRPDPAGGRGVRIRAELEEILSAHTGQSVETLRHDADRDRVFTARAALEYGLVDQVMARAVLGKASAA